jgi:DNA-binding transcriptional MerR regulator
MTPPLFTIGKLSTASGVKVPTIRFYEQSGLLPAPPRTASDRRLYDDAALRRLAFIRHARQLGFDLDAIRSLLDLSDLPDHNCEEANRIAEQHLEAVSDKIRRLKALERELVRMTKACAVDGSVSACKVIEVLQDAECRHS